jgi:uncharacterized membrane protein YhaH (DUF805 family)
MSIKNHPDHSRGSFACPLVRRLAFAVWFVAVYWTLAGEGIVSGYRGKSLVLQARGLLEALIVLLIVLALSSFVNGSSVSAPRPRRIRFVMTVSLLVMCDLMLSAIQRNLPVGGVVAMTCVFLAAVGVLIRSRSGPKATGR